MGECNTIDIVLEENEVCVLDVSRLLTQTLQCLEDILLALPQPKLIMLFLMDVVDTPLWLALKMLEHKQTIWLMELTQEMRLQPIFTTKDQHNGDGIVLSFLDLMFKQQMISQ